ncbi:glycosyltransferase family 4 protein [Atopococcus tabaci]|uniref:glycosyltransferase family 4 protein n=1 Tax=Atopococcus tabaci TaxID=269774 RepID=UPI0004058BC5|nr:glycosyltransferase family 4 protein [Atopococcus tabaci]
MTHNKKVIHINAGGEVGGGKTHIVSLVSSLGNDKAEVLVFEEGPVAVAARDAGCRVHVLGQKSRYDVAVLKRLKKFLNEEVYSVVHTHGARANFMLSLIAGQLDAIWVTTVHSDPFLEFQEKGVAGKAFQQLNVRSIRRADHIITVSQALEKQLHEIGVPDEKMTVVRNGIAFGSAPTASSKKSIFTMVHTARLHPVKGHDLLFESLKKAALPEWRVYLVGDGELRAELEREAARLGIHRHVEFLGWLAPEDVQRTVRSADVALLTSYSETFPLVLLEAAKEGTPFIATDVGDVHVLLPDARYGWLVPPKDASALAAALQEAYSEWEAGTLQEKGTLVYERTKQLFSLEQMAENTLAVYEKALKK